MPRGEKLLLSGEATAVWMQKSQLEELHCVHYVWQRACAAYYRTQNSKGTLVVAAPDCSTGSRGGEYGRSFLAGEGLSFGDPFRKQGAEYADRIMFFVVYSSLR